MNKSSQQSIKQSNGSQRGKKSTARTTESRQRAAEGSLLLPLMTPDELKVFIKATTSMHRYFGLLTKPSPLRTIYSRELIGAASTLFYLLQVVGLSADDSSKLLTKIVLSLLQSRPD